MSQDKTEKMEYFISLLDDYIDGKLAPGQTIEIEKALQEDSFLNEVLKQHVQARSNMRIAGEEELRKKFADNFDPIPDVVVPKSNLLKVLIPIIVLLGLATAAYYFFSEQDKPQERLPYTASAGEGGSRLLLASVEDPSYDLLRSDKDTVIADRWQQAVEYFISKNYKEANNILTTLEEDSTFVKDHFGKFSLMKGVANLKMKKFDIADQALSRIRSDNPYVDQAEWYLALTYFYSDDITKAKKQLEQISSNDSHYKQDQAKAFISELLKSQ